MGPFHLKYRDTRPLYRVTLLNPDGTVHDLTGAAAFFLHIRISGSEVRLTRALALVGLPTAGTLQYTWVAGDWDVPSSPNGDGAYEAGGLVKGVHALEHEVKGAGDTRQTFPNAGFDTLSIITDIAQA